MLAALPLLAVLVVVPLGVVVVDEVEAGTDWVGELDECADFNSDMTLSSTYNTPLFVRIFDSKTLASLKYRSCPMMLTRMVLLSSVEYS